MSAAPRFSTAFGKSVRIPARAALAAAGLLAVAVYVPSFFNGFAYDDVPIIANDVRVTEFRLGEILSGGYWEDAATALYRPLTTFSFAVDWQLSSGNPAWFHAVNALWHAAVTVIIHLLLLAVGAGAGAALAGAAVFAVHPLHVEAVANTVGRAELMAAAFVLGAALLWTRPARVLRTARSVVALLVLFVLALASKEGAVVLPGVLVLVDIGRGRLRPHRIGAWFASRWVPYAATVGVLIVFFAVRTAVIGAVVPAALDPSLEVLDSRLHRFYTALQAWPHYFRLIFFPRMLLNEYSPRITMPMPGAGMEVLVGGALLLGCIVGGVLAWFRRRPLLAAALLWFPITVFPVSNLVVPIGVLIAERTLYLPSAALALGVAAVPSALGLERARLRAPLVFALAVAIGVMIPRTVVRIADWRSTNAIFSALVRDRPDNFRGVWHFARLAASRGEPKTALIRYGEAMELWPHRRGLVVEAAFYAAQSGAADYALGLTDYALRNWPQDLNTNRLHAGLLLDRGDTARARQHVLAALRTHPQDSLLNVMRAATEPRPSGSVRTP